MCCVLCVVLCVVCCVVGTGDRRYDIVPGAPDQSILLFRMDNVEPDQMMPEVGRSTIHTEGIALIRAWIESLPGDCG